MLENLRKYDILLASKSPRRRELLAMLRLPFKTITLGGVDESYPQEMEPSAVPQYLAEKKADAYATKIHDNELIITADTVVICEGRILGKPVDDQDAHEMLKFLSGKTHQVVTGVCVTSLEMRVSFSALTEVKFAHLTDEEIDHYVRNYQPLDKAGAYGIQEWIGAVAIENINGSYYNVMGLPVHKLYRVLQKF